MKTTNKTPDVDRAIAQSERLWPTTSQAGLWDGAAHICWVGDCFQLLDTTGSAALDIDRAGELADQLAELDAYSADFLSVVLNYVVPGTSRW